MAEMTVDEQRREATARIMGMAGEPVEQAIAIMEFLRSPAGCPWDREQTFDTIKRHTLEETYEVFDAIERKDWPALEDELGDLLLQVLFYAQMAADAGLFTIREVAAGLGAKLIRRHPHIFASGEAGAEAGDAAAVVRRWEEIKRAERGGAGATEESMMAGVPRTMPAMLEAAKLGSKAAKVGFDWAEVGGLFAKLREEAGELEAEVAGAARERMEDEFGDVLFTAVNLGRHLGLDAESALRGANAKFRRRFGAMERAAGGRDGLERATAEEMEGMWVEAKRGE